MTTAISSTSRAAAVGIKTSFSQLGAQPALILPQRVALVGQGASLSSYVTTKQLVTSAEQVGTLYGFGSPLHLAALELLPTNGDGLGTIPLTVYPLEDDGAGVVSTGDVTPGGSPTIAASYVVRVNNKDSVPFTISVGDSVATIVTAMTAAINATLEMSIIAVDNTTVVDFTSKWEGVSANDIKVSVVGSTTAGNTFAVTQPVGGLNNPVVDPALAQFGPDWETLVLNCLNIDDTTALDEYEEIGTAKWGALESMPFVAFTGDNAATPLAAITVPDARKTDKVNSVLQSPGSLDMPFAIAARQLVRIAVLANENPPHDYVGRSATGLVPGPDADQFDYAGRDQAMKGGSSTVTIKDGVVTIGDVVTFYHPVGETDPAFRYVVDIIKLMTIIYNTRNTFDSPNWAGAPLIPDGQASNNRAAKSPSMAKAAVALIIDQMALEAIISDPAAAKASIVAAIDGVNAKRLNVEYTVPLSGNANVISIDLNFGFNFGS